jgi:hypothetical protein
MNIICHDDNWTKDGSQRKLIDMWGFEGNALRALYGEHYRDKKRRSAILHGYIKIRPVKMVDKIAVMGYEEEELSKAVMRYLIENEKLMGLPFSFRDEFVYVSKYDRQVIK